MARETAGTIGFIPIARPTFDTRLAEEVTQIARQNLETEGFQLVAPAGLVMDLEAMEDTAHNLHHQGVDLLLVLQATFADSTMVLRLAEMVDLPLLLWAIPEARTGGRLRLNSFCGINLAGHSLRRAGHMYDYVYAPPDSVEAVTQIRIMAAAAAVKRRLKGARIGRVGENPAGFDTCLVNHAGLRARFGIDVVQLELDTVFARARAAEPQAVHAAGDRIQARLAGLDTLDQNATAGTISTYVTLGTIASEQRLNGIAVRCWPEFFTDLGCAACGAMSMLSDALTPCSCEADVNGTITQLILQWISGEPAFGSDLVAFDTADDVAILWHCGLAPLAMADPDVVPRGTVHSNRGMPLLMEFPLKPGRVTLARLSEASGDFRLVIGTGEMVKAPPSFTGTTGTLRFDSGAQAVMNTIMHEGLEHHLSLTYGDHADVLEAIARMLDLPVLRL